MPDSIQPNLLILDEVDSTNTYAREHFDDLPDGTLVVARRQTAGRGRRGRSWLSPPGINFTGSILLKRLEDGFHAGCLLGVAALSLLRELAPELPAYLKWPNDIYVENRKLAGLLSESARIENGRPMRSKPSTSPPPPFWRRQTGNLISIFSQKNWQKG